MIFTVQIPQQWGCVCKAYFNLLLPFAFKYWPVKACLSIQEVVCNSMHAQMGMVKNKKSY